MAYRQILLPANRVFRLAKPPDIISQNWYFVVNCKGCGKPIYLISDPHEGRMPQPFVGPGEISAPCKRCQNDSRYASDSIALIRATENIVNNPVRANAAKNMPQKIDPKYKDVNPTFGPGFLEGRPEASAIIARCIGLWTDVESELARLLSTMLQANSDAAIALFLSIESGRQQSKILDVVAQVVLDEKDRELFSALLNYKKSVEAERNNLAHSRFGTSDKMPTAVVGVDLSDYTRFAVRVASKGVNEADTKWLRSKMYVYEIADLERIARDTEDLHNQLSFFIGYIWSSFEDAPDKDAWRSERYPQLCAAPRIQQELAILREGRQKKSEAQE